MLTRQPVGGTTQRPSAQRSAGNGRQTPLDLTHALDGAKLQSRLLGVRPALSRKQSLVVDLTEEGAADLNERQHTWEGDIGGSSRSRELIDLDEEDEGGRSRKRAKVEDGGMDAEQHEEAADTAHRIRPGKPLAPPPPQMARKSGGSTSRSSARDMAARRADGLTPPTIATRLPEPKKVADFSPWNGSHAEDVLNEQVVKSGYFDKGPGPSQNESNSARHSIWPNLSQRNNIALQTLSHLFTQAMEKRQALGRCTAPSSFKPPPRVTVTDTKREAWLRDLANRNVPLRRQSRTIPHGIRNKLLMEQCLTKSIPLQRAVWLAKCVGANELRAFRRKGVSGMAAAQGEAKWVREWTVQVEQFLDDVVAACGQAGWRDKINYTIKLVTAFYTERLLDKEHYLAFIESSFAKSSLAKLPFWTVVIQIYWRDLVSFGVRGRKLAQAVLEQLRAVTEKAHPLFDKLKSQLQKLIVVLANTERGCLIIPRTWDQYKQLLNPSGSSALTAAWDSALANVDRRNQRLSSPTKKTPKTTRGALVELYDMLDAIDLAVDGDQIAHRCLSILRDPSVLVKALLDWASTKYRSGKARIYLVANIIGRLQDFGLDTDGAVLAYLGNAEVSPTLEAQNVYAIIASLAEGTRFATGRYMQWLIASGALSRTGSTSLATGLLAALPVDAMPQHVQNTRLSLLRRLSPDFLKESARLAVLQESITTAFSEDTYTFVELSSLDDLSGSAKYALGSWIITSFTVTDKEARISLAQYCLCRAVLERINDMTGLAKLIIATMSSDDLRVLASLADTLTLHASEFAAMNNVKALMDSLVERYRTLRSQQAMERGFLLAFLRLAQLFPERTALVKLLGSDLVAYEHQHPSAVCSPASDNLIGMQDGSLLERDEELDAVFASGNSMDEQLMQRVFLRIMNRAERQPEATEESASKVCAWLNQLKAVDSTGFERLCHGYMRALLQSDQSASSVEGVQALIASDSLDFPAVADVAKETSRPRTAAIALELIISPAGKKMALGSVAVYRYGVKQACYCRSNPKCITELLRGASEDPAHNAEDPYLVTFILDTVARHPGTCFDVLQASDMSGALLRNSNRHCTALLRRGQPQGIGEDMALNTQAVIACAQPLNIGVCVGWLRLSATRGVSKTTEAGEEMKDALLGAIQRESPVWPQLLTAGQPDVIKAIHEWAREQLLFPSVDKTRPDDDPHWDKVIGLYRDVFDITYGAVQDEDDAHVIVAITEKMKLVEQQLAEPTRLDDMLSAQQTTSAALRLLDLLLHLVTVHAQCSVTTEASTQSRGSLLAVLCSLLLQTRLQTRMDILDYIHDVAATICDSLPEEVVASLARTIGVCNPQNRRITSLLGSSPSPDSWLALASRAQPLGLQQQRVLSRQPSLQQPMGVRSMSQAGLQQPQQQQQQQQQTPRTVPAQRQPAQPVEMKYTPYPLRRWEIMPDPTPVMGENDCSISLGLFGARKV